MLDHRPAKTLHFSGYEWEVRRTLGSSNASQNLYDPANAWVDRNGFLHLRIARRGSGWTSADMRLSNSLGYGSYRFVVRNLSDLEPAAILSISTRDDSGPYREMDIQIGRWGETAGENAQYVVQPYYVPANIVRFMAPAGTLTYSMIWESGRAFFQTVRGSEAGGQGGIIAAHAFTSGFQRPKRNRCG
jgi:hypothetical protein